MIVSCHVPKTAGTTFRKLLRAQFGDGLHVDYGDRVGWTGPDADDWRRERGIPAAIAAADDQGLVRAVHGHFYASKYAEAYPEAELVAFVREPVARVISNYQYLVEHPEIEHPLVHEFHDTGPDLAQWAEWPWARNVQSLVLDVPFERFVFIGITEQFDDAARAFDAIFDTSLAGTGSAYRHNATSPMAADAGTRARIAELNADDVELYRRATARFARATVRLGRGVPVSERDLSE